MNPKRELGYGSNRDVRIGDGGGRAWQRRLQEEVRSTCSVGQSNARGTEEEGMKDRALEGATGEMTMMPMTTPTRQPCALTSSCVRVSGTASGMLERSHEAK